MPRFQTFHGLPHDAAAKHFAVVVKVHHAALADGAMVASSVEVVSGHGYKRST